MSDKTPPDSDKVAPLFVRPSEGDANRMLKELETGEAAAQPTRAAGENERSDVPPTVPAATMRRRHRGLVWTFLLVVIVPAAVTAWYLWAVAEDQYSSVTGFTVRTEEGQAASELLGGLAALTGGTAAGDSDILYEFVQSQALISRVDAALDIRAHYSSRWDVDPVFALWPDASMEDLEDYWQRIVRVSYDQGAGLLEVRALAFDRDMAQAIARQILVHSQDMINDLNAQAREDAMQFARIDLEEALARLRDARAALTAFRTRTQIVDPQADIQGRMGVMNNLQQQLAQALIDLDLLTENTSPEDPRIVQAKRRIEVIRERLVVERDSLATGGEDTVAGQDYPTVIAEFEGLVVDRVFAEENYGAALAALDLARDNVARQSRYLATYIQPTRAETSEYPQRETILALVAFFALLSWSIAALIYYSVRDRG